MESICKGLSYDPDNTYSVPYFWGTVGIVYNKNNIDKKDLEKEGWNIFLDQKYKGHIYMYDSERDSFMMALKALGYSMNTDDEAQLQQAYEWLVKVVDTMNPEIVTDEVIDAMINGNKDMALVYSGDAAYILSENEEMAYYMPSEGTNLWSDAMVIPKNAKNPKLANEYINFILEYENSMKNSVFVGYASSNGEVLDTLSGEGGDFEGNEAYLPRVGYTTQEDSGQTAVDKTEEGGDDVKSSCPLRGTGRCRTFPVYLCEERRCGDCSDCQFALQP